MRFRYILSLMILLAHGAYAIHINEVMYNPEGADNNLEFVEIYLDSNQSLDGWMIGDSDSNDTLTTLYFTDSSYALIVEEGYAYENSDASFYSAGATIGNNLNNDLDAVFLFDPDGILIDYMSYDGGIANNNGMSMEYYNHSWYESMAYGGTPGDENSIIGYLNSLQENITDPEIDDGPADDANETDPEIEEPAGNQTNSTGTPDI